jgi:4-hydroxy-3-polyprenylbenzoate decarboxylase
MSGAFAIGFSGGSGARYGLRLVEVLLSDGHTVHLAATGAARRVLKYEAGLDPGEGSEGLRELFPAALRPGLHVHAIDAVEAAPASGSAGIRATILCPCSMGTLARVAHGFSSNLVERAADVALKQGRPLVIVPRETPLGELHLENMLRLKRLGAVILPAMPGFYHRPQTIEDLVDFVVARILDSVGLVHRLSPAWETPPASGTDVWNEGEL